MTRPRASVAGAPGGPSQAVRWATSIGGAVLLHVAAVATMLLEFGADAEAPDAAPQAAMTVELAPLPSAPEPRASAMPPGPEQVEQRIRTQPQPRPEPRRIDLPPEARSEPPPDALATPPEPDPEPAAEQRAMAERTTAAPSSPVETPQPSQPLQAPVEGSPNAQSTGAIQTWEDRLLAHLERHKRYPGQAQRRRQEDVVYLRFTMDRSGQVLQWNVWRSRGYALLDEEVNALIQRASPLPPPPDELGGRTIEMVVPVEFFLRRQLARGVR